MRRRSSFTVLVAVIFALSLTTPPASADTSSKTLSNSAQQAGSLNELKASDTQLLAAISTLNNEVATQQASVDSAKQSVEAADKQVSDVQAHLQGSQQELDHLKDLESQRAIELYMSPNEDDFVTNVLSSNGIDDATTRTELMSEFSGNDYNALDLLQAAQKQYNKEQKAALAAQKLADQRRDTEQQKLDSLNAALASQNRLEISLQQRIQAYAGEDTASARGVSQAQNGRASRGSDATTDDARQSAAGLQWPVHGSHQIDSPFGMRWGRMHEGVDIQASTGTPIYAAKAGTITYAGNESGYGNYTCIQHGGGFQTCYGHQSKIMVSVGQQVSQGQEIGLAGATGDAQGAHLHFETCLSTGKECFYGTYKNPMDYLPNCQASFVASTQH